VLVEAAMAFMILFTLVFGIVEFGLQFKDSLSVTNAVRAGARAGSAATRTQSYNVVVVNAVTTAQAAVGSGAPTDLWVYKADLKTGMPIDSSGNAEPDFSHGCSFCEQYSWSGSQWTCASGCDTSASAPYPAQSWPGVDSEAGATPNNTQYSCLSAPAGYPNIAGTHTGLSNDPYGTGNAWAGPDEIGVYLRIVHKNITGLFGSTKTITDHAVARLEPVALTQACSG
jgi:TadE-like protein